MNCLALKIKAKSHMILFGEIAKNKNKNMQKIN